MSQVLRQRLELRLSGYGERPAEFALRDDRLIETEQPRAAFGHPNRSCHGRRINSSDLWPQARGHLVEPLKLQSPQLLGPFDGGLTEGGEFGPDVRAVCTSTESCRAISRYEPPAFRSSTAITRRSAAANEVRRALTGCIVSAR